LGRFVPFFKKNFLSTDCLVCLEENEEQEKEEEKTKDIS